MIMENERQQYNAFIAELIQLYVDKGEKLDWTKAQKIGEKYDLKGQRLMQLCETAVVHSACCIIQTYEEILHRLTTPHEVYRHLIDLYNQQVTIQPLDSKSKILQQYSTPCPLAYLLGKYIEQYRGEGYLPSQYLEPSAGNGMLTISLHHKGAITVNELDDMRRENLESFEAGVKFNHIYDYDASKERFLGKGYPYEYFDGIITNPPFGNLPKGEELVRNGWTIDALDYKMATVALDYMKDDGRAAIIVGGKMFDKYWKPLKGSAKKVLYGKWKVWIGYLYAQYNVEDVIYIDGTNIYRKQGTTYPIVVILINGRHQYDENIRPNYVFDPTRDYIVKDFDELYERIYPHIERVHRDRTDERDTMRMVLKQLVKELGEEEGKETFEWYCKTYNVDITNPIPDVVRWEVFGTDKTFREIDELRKKKADSTDHDHRLRLAKAKAKAIKIFVFAQEQNGLNGTEKSIIEKWLNPADVSYIERLSNVDEKKRIQLLENKFGKRLYPIAFVPYRFLPIINIDIADNKVYCSKAYFLNHYLHHNKTTSKSDYLSIPQVLFNPDYIVETENDYGDNSIVFVKRENRYKVAIITLEKTQGKIILHKTFFVQQKKPYKNIARLFEILPEDERPFIGIPSIVHKL